MLIGWSEGSDAGRVTVPRSQNFELYISTSSKEAVEIDALNQFPYTENDLVFILVTQPAEDINLLHRRHSGLRGLDLTLEAVVKLSSPAEQQVDPGAESGLGSEI